MVKEARTKGLTAPVLLMGAFGVTFNKPPRLTEILGYYNPLLAYGEDKAIQDAHESGANGFILVDLPPEEAITFREKCTKSEYAPSGSPICTTAHFPRHSISYVPLIAPSTTLHRIKFLASIADTFIYIVSKVKMFRHSTLFMILTHIV